MSGMSWRSSKFKLTHLKQSGITSGRPVFSVAGNWVQAEQPLRSLVCQTRDPSPFWTMHLRFSFSQRSPCTPPVRGNEHCRFQQRRVKDFRINRDQSAIKSHECRIRFLLGFRPQTWQTPDLAVSTGCLRDDELKPGWISLVKSGPPPLYNEQLSLRRLTCFQTPTSRLIYSSKQLFGWEALPETREKTANFH